MSQENEQKQSTIEERLGIKQERYDSFSDIVISSMKKHNGNIDDVLKDIAKESNIPLEAALMGFVAGQSVERADRLMKEMMGSLMKILGKVDEEDKEEDGDIFNQLFNKKPDA